MSVATQRPIWGWMLIILLLGVYLQLYLTDMIELTLEPVIFLPLLAGWIGFRAGRPSIWPWLLFLPIVCISLNFWEDLVEFGFGIVAGFYLLGLILAQHFGKLTTGQHSEKLEKVREQGWPFCLIFILAGIWFNFGFDQTEFDFLGIDFLLEPAVMLPVAAFLGTAALGFTSKAFIRGLLYFVVVMVTIEAVQLLLDLLTRGEWRLPLGYSAEVLLTPFLEWEFAIDWRPMWGIALPLMVGAGCLGLALRPFFAKGQLPSTSATSYLHWGLWLTIMFSLLYIFWREFYPLFKNILYDLDLAFFMAPDSVARAKMGSGQWEVMSAATDIVPVSRPEEEIIVITGSHLRAVLLPFVNTIAGVLFVGIAFAFGLADSSRKLIYRAVYLGATIAIASLVFDFAANLLDQHTKYPSEMYADSIVIFVGMLIAASLAYHFGAIARNHFKEGAQTEEKEIELTNDLTSFAYAARRLDVSATIRAFSVVAAFGLVIYYLVQIIPQVPAMLEFAREFDDDVFFILMLFIGIVLSVLSPFVIVWIDWLSRQPYRFWSAGLAIFALGTALIFGGMAVLLLGNLLWTYISYIPEWGPVDAFYGLLETDFDEASFVEYAAGSIILSIVTWFGYRAFRVERILAQPIPRSALLGFINNPNLGRRLSFIAGMPSSMWRWVSFLKASTWMFLLSRPSVYLGFLLIFPDYESIPSLQGLSVRQLLIFGGVAILLGHIMFALAKRMAARRIWTADQIAGEGDAPILFLRSFQDDQLRFSRSWLDLPGRWFDLWSFRRNVDELLVDEFAQFGPVIALGKPGDKAPRFGAYRRFTDHDEWQDVIRDAARRARAIIVSTGDTPGLNWEYNLIRDEGYLDKTIFLFPPAKPDSERTKETVNLFAQAYPDLDPTPLLSDAALIAVPPERWGDRGWISKKPSAQAYLVALRRFFQQI